MKKKHQSILIIFLLVVIAFLLVMVFIPDKENDFGKGILFEPIHGSQNQTYDGKNRPEISIPGWGAIKLPAGVTEADVSLHNPEANRNYYDLSFTLKFADTGEVIFSTGNIEPGYKCSHVTLTRKLEPGEYNAVMFVQPCLKDEKHTLTNNAEMNTLLIVE